MVMIFRFPENAGNFSTTGGPVSFLGRTLLRGVTTFFSVCTNLIKYRFIEKNAWGNSFFLGL
jgi:hypothetical protein